MPSTPIDAAVVMAAIPNITNGLWVVCCSYIRLVITDDYLVLVFVLVCLVVWVLWCWWLWCFWVLAVWLAVVLELA